VRRRSRRGRDAPGPAADGSGGRAGRSRSRRDRGGPVDPAPPRPAGPAAHGPPRGTGTTRPPGRRAPGAYRETRAYGPGVGAPARDRGAYGRIGPEAGGAPPRSEAYSGAAAGRPDRLHGRLADPVGRMPDRPRRSSPAHLAPRYDRRRLGALVLVAALVLGCAAAAHQVVQLVRDDADTSDDLAGAPDEPLVVGTTTTAPAAPEQAAPASGFPTPGLLTFRGSPTRSYHGEGPVPTDPRVLWTYPADGEGMCAESAVGDEVKVWCGSGWTGQPAVFERDGRTWVVFGAYDRMVHFVDYETGEDILPPFETGDIIKGSVTVDPDGLPLVYTGSRDNKLRVIAIDRPEPTELWSLDARDVSPTMWNDDWDGSPLVLGDYLYEGGENSQFHIVKLNRSIGDDGLVQVAPELVFNTPGWDEELLAALETRRNDVSIENSVAYHDGVVYFANSGGLVQGWDVSGIAEGVAPTRVLRFWAGDDIDASIVVDEEGYLYVAVENERGNSRSAEVGQLLKLDPRSPDDPLVWSVHDSGGFWATPALHRDIVIAASDGGTVYGVDRETGEVRWTFQLPPPTWQSAVVVDDTLVQGDCQGGLHAYDVSDTTVAPPELWRVDLEGCIESTPALWHGRIFVGTRGGLFYAIGDA